MSSAVASIRSYINLTKPTIVLSFVLTGATGLVMEGSLLANPIQFIFVLLAIALTGASANGLEGDTVLGSITFECADA
ncbi:MAG: hypothetical protein Q7S68_00910, partial [Deltaproteobacteria bacterium]|nr:hypothetical protein [Deltaproteobacteria bacterium]